MGEGGTLVKGEGRERVSRPANGFIGPWPASWDRNYDAKIHAPAALMGGTYIRPNRFNMSGHVVDGNGALRGFNECPECGTEAWGQTEIVHTENPNPMAPRWIKGWRWCSTCTRIEGDRLVRIRQQPSR